MARIVNITGRQIIDSQGKPTVEATVQLDDGATASSSSPSSSLISKEEAVELRDHNNSEYFGQGVSKAVQNINGEIRQKIVGMDPLYQTQVDQALVNLDGTVNKSRLGANAILAVSQAVIKAAAASLRLPLFVYVKEKYQLIQTYRLPTPIFNLINGGRHGSGTLDFQEYQLVPASHLAFPQALRIGVEMFMAIDKILEQKGAIRAMGIEGGYSPNLATNADALEIFAEAMRLTSYTLAQDAFLGLDVGPRWFHKSSKYTVKDRPQPMTGKELVKYFEELHQQFRVFAFEDPLLADAWNDWKFMTAEIGKTAMIIADDLIATNKTLLMKAIQEQACNAVVIKPNRVGTITEAIEIISIAKQAGWHTVMSHRSGETTDDVLADIAVGVGTDYVKFGAPARGERVVKYNRLLRIAEILDQAQNQTTGAPAPTTPSNPATSFPSAPLAAKPAEITAAPTAPSAPQPDIAPVAPMATPAVSPPPLAPVTPSAPDSTPIPALASTPTIASQLAALRTTPAGLAALSPTAPASSETLAAAAPNVPATAPPPASNPASIPSAVPTASSGEPDLQKNLDDLIQQITNSAAAGTMPPPTTPETVSAPPPVVPAPPATPSSMPPLATVMPTEAVAAPSPAPNPIVTNTNFAATAPAAATPSLTLPPTVRMGAAPSPSLLVGTPTASAAGSEPLAATPIPFASPPAINQPTTSAPTASPALPSFTPGGDLPLPPPVPPPLS